MSSLPSATLAATPRASGTRSSRWRNGTRLLPLLALLAPFVVGNEYQLHVLTLIGIFWVLVVGLDLVVGYAGQLSVGHVGLLAIGAYTIAIVSARFGIDPLVATAIAGAMGGLCGFLLGLPSLRLPGFYFAMATLAFSLIVTEILVAQNGLTGGGAGISAPLFGAPFDTPRGFYWLVAVLGLAVTWLTWNVSRRMWGRALIALRDSEVAAASVGIPVYRLKLSVFTFSGVTAGIAGALFASLQGYITPEAFAFELGMFFFICIIIGGRGNIVGPFIGTAVLTLLPEVAAPLARLGNLLYSVLLLAVVLLIPKGIGSAASALMDRHRDRRQAPPITPDLERLAAAIARPDSQMGTSFSIANVSKRFGGVAALTDVTLEVRPGEIQGLIGPNGSGKTTMLNVLTGYYPIDTGRIGLGADDFSTATTQRRAFGGIARTFQKPRLLPTLSVLDNVMIGAWRDARAGLLSTMFSLPRARSEDALAARQAEELLIGVGLGHALHERADALEHGEQRFLEIARALAVRPRFILLDEPAGGLSFNEIDKLGELLLTIKACGIGVLLVEHHTDFVFRLCDRVTAIDFGKVITRGTPTEVRNNADVVRVYLGA